MNEDEKKVTPNLDSEHDLNNEQGASAGTEEGVDIKTTPEYIAIKEKCLIIRQKNLKNYRIR